MPGKRGKRKRLHKFACPLGHHHMDFKSLALQCSHQFRSLICGDSAGDPHGNSHGSIVAGFLWRLQSWAAIANAWSWAPLAWRPSRQISQDALQEGSAGEHRFFTRIRCIVSLHSG